MAQESQDWFAVNFYNLLYIEYILYLNICYHLLFICLFVYLFIYLFIYLLTVTIMIIIIERWGKYLKFQLFDQFEESMGKEKSRF